MLCLTCLQSTAQESGKAKRKNEHELKKFYGLSGAELIFSVGDVKADSLTVENRWRFSLFFHIQEQFHYNFNKHVGFFTGVSLINVGFTHDFTTPTNETFKLKQRSYSLGLPLALKLGNMPNGNYIALGGTAEFMIHYKHKIFFNDTKEKYNDWFSDRVNIFNPSVFLDIRNKTGGYIRFKYYLDNFLTTKNIAYTLPTTNTTVNITSTQSPLFYIAIGSVFLKKKNNKLTKDDV